MITAKQAAALQQKNQINWQPLLETIDPLIRKAAGSGINYVELIVNDDVPFFLFINHIRSFGYQANRKAYTDNTIEITW